MEEKVSFAHHKVIKYVIRDAMILMLMALCGILSDFVPSLLCKVFSLFMVSFSVFMQWKGGQLKWMIIRSVPALLSHKQNHLFLSPLLFLLQKQHERVREQTEGVNVSLRTSSDSLMMPRLTLSELDSVIKVRTHVTFSG